MLTENPVLDHMEGFEREATFKEILQAARERCPSIKASVVELIIERVQPEFLVGLFEARPCRRRLRYAGLEGVPDEGGSFFQKGKEYTSMTFNGGVYGIEGHDDLIGCAHFERLD